MRTRVGHIGNRGITLIEVIVTVLLLSIIAIPTLRAFGIARDTNKISNRYTQAEDLAVSITEQMKQVKFDKINETLRYRTTSDYQIIKDYFNIVDGTGKLLIPNKFNTNNSVWDITQISDNEYNIELDNINGVKAEFKVSVNVNKSGYDTVNSTEYTFIQSLSNDDTCIIDPTGSTGLYETDINGYIEKITENNLKYYKQNSINSYDNRALASYINANVSFVTKRWQEKCDEIDAFNEANRRYGIQLSYPILGEGDYEFANSDSITPLINKETIIEVRTGDTFTFLNTYIKYTLNQQLENGDWIPIIEDESNKENENELRNVSFTVDSNEKYMELNNIYIMYVPLGDDWGDDNIIIKNGTTINNSCAFNLYVDSQPFYTDGTEIDTNNLVSSINIPIFKAPSIKIESLNPSKNIKIYTNTDLSIANIDIADNTIEVNNHLNVYKDAENKTYKIKVEVRDNLKNLLYITRETNITN